jgi:hypothetical protein
MIGVITLIALYHSALISLSQFLFLNKTGNGLLTSASLLQKNEGLLCSDVSGSPERPDYSWRHMLLFPPLSTDIAQEKADDDAQCSAHAAGQATSPHRPRSITPSAATDFPQDADYSGNTARAH